MMVDQELIIQALVRTVQASEDPRGQLWERLTNLVRDELKLTIEEIHAAILEAVDQVRLIDNCSGWLSLPNP